MATPIKDQLTNNTIRTYYALDEAMVKAHREDRDEYAVSTARSLLGNADLPLLIRARACMVLGCSEQPGFLDMAKDGVRIAELGLCRCTSPGETEHQLVEACRQVLDEAQKAWDEKEKRVWGDGELVRDGDEKEAGEIDEQTEKLKKEDR
ncbi:hypothetical protein M409DRAFT_26982 [Zasmidium cellare ATCC 36951]|uniref:Uncharacterized protein n=1 Tax=Zasmidium cellare ATCC 36951 TaxID=1080233 RepID=A0A6A6C6J6_ZASCE|nr:uncharacterized protein M409DRAFT_26982 [Zasmidium cellare ATCC 36951]KAF2162744.1 hypothetical protein M409DRAFT_26982 [Zasmidium cellare ATCC 36951]